MPSERAKVFLLSHDFGAEEDLMGTYTTLDKAIDACRSARFYSTDDKFLVYECELDGGYKPTIVWECCFRHGPVSDGKYGWEEENSMTGEIVFTHVASREGFLYDPELGRAVPKPPRACAP